MTFILRRLVFYLAAFVVAASINFALPRLMPGNPIDIMFSQAEGRIPPEVRDRMAETFGFVDKPLYQEFLAYLASVFTWDLGVSIKFYPLPVAEVLGAALEWARHFGDLERCMDELLAQMFGASVKLMDDWINPGRYVSGTEIADVGIAELVQFNDLPGLMLGAGERPSTSGSGQSLRAKAPRVAAAAKRGN